MLWCNFFQAKMELQIYNLPSIKSGHNSGTSVRAPAKANYTVFFIKVSLLKKTLKRLFCLYERYVEAQKTRRKVSQKTRRICFSVRGFLFFLTPFSRSLRKHVRNSTSWKRGRQPCSLSVMGKQSWYKDTWFRAAVYTSLQVRYLEDSTGAVKITR